jgi:putative transcriptional regulator
VTFPAPVDLNYIRRKTATRQTVIAIEQDKYSPSLETAFKVPICLVYLSEQCFQYDPYGER